MTSDIEGTADAMSLPGRVRQATERGRCWVRRFRASLSTPGLLVGTLFFAASLSPSLLPRGWLMQGILAGLGMAAGYAIGVAYRWLWGYLELPLPERRTQRVILWSSAVVCLAVACVFLWRASDWQNAVRTLMELAPVDSARPFRIGLIAAFVFATVLAFARLFHLTFRVLSHRLGRGIPRRVANVLGLSLAVMIFWSAIDGVVFRYALHAADASFRNMDERLEAELEEPTDPLRTGSATSLVSWQDLGRTGRDFVASIPTAAELETFFGEQVAEPLRVYVGLNAGESIEERVSLALAELERVGAFERSALVIVTPTGTGWVDPAAMRSVEYLHRGDIASVAIQYSYLPSWLSLIVEPEYGAETADALFSAVYGRWRELPRDIRPELYLYGLSLGALNSQQTLDLYDVIGDPVAGALWSGPPFRSDTWSEITRARRPGTPAWLPGFGNGSVVRFMNQRGLATPPGAEWGPMRIVYLQHASDPITFFAPEILYRKPEWLEEPRGPDVAAELTWYPVVTMMQLLADLAVADTSPPGYGHVFAAEHYVDAWRAVTGVADWPDEEIARLKRALSTLK